MKNVFLNVFSGITAALAIGLLGFAGETDPEFVFLMAPFGATAVIVFGLPDSPLAQPQNVFFGHLLTALIGVIFVQYIGVGLVEMAIATGLGVTGMLMTKTTHPPAGANPMLIMMTGQSWSFLLTPVVTGALAIILVGMVAGKVRKVLLTD
ncbi:HPP family protein [Endozoicomonas sp. OPT23]|uniref:HPP family protein n=1 Tax=Endozoicomonas sp. OPT23 TaxID=2072845 RepID=UPI00129B7D4C|nr:HPP family protein [Endozoicomonas sp. OPT23]MRI31441.1 HPP family protein [Endozoicomonas sp. OPT23]